MSCSCLRIELSVCILKIAKKLIPFFALVCLLVLPVFSVEKTIELGGKTGWSQLSVVQGVTTGEGRFGYDAIQLESTSRKVTAYTDLLLSFEKGQVYDDSGRYDVTSSSCRIVPDAARGKAAALFLGSGNGFLISGEQGTIFGTEGWSGSFVIEFWLCPAIVENGETLLSWRSSRNVADYPLYQMMSAVFTGSHLEWNLTNIFSGYTDNNGEVVISGIKNLIPGQWSHHSLVYSQDTGMIEYRVDGILEDLKYITSNKREGGYIYPLFIGCPSAVEICPNYTGKLDDFRILRSDGTEEDANFFIANSLVKDGGKYDIDGGRFETHPLMVQEGSSLKRIRAEFSEPPETAVQLFVRSGENFYEWTETYPEWIPVCSGQEIANISGKYFQVAAQLYPDGRGSKTPSITSIAIDYEEEEPPLPPFRITATPKDGSVELKWSHSIDEVTSYYVYYGERPGEYLGRVALEGDSPIWIGDNNSINISGLKNGRIYYFAIASEKNGRLGVLSSEVYARPMIMSN